MEVRPKPRPVLRSVLASLHFCAAVAAPSACVAVNAFAASSACLRSPAAEVPVRYRSAVDLFPSAVSLQIVHQSVRAEDVQELRHKQRPGQGPLSPLLCCFICALCLLHGWIRPYPLCLIPYQSFTFWVVAF
jgi:hypothetical protein